MNAVISIQSSGRRIDISFDGTESGLWKRVGQELLTCKIPDVIRVSCLGDTAELKVGRRGSYTKDGVEYPSMLVRAWNNICLPSSVYKKVYLTCVNPESNNYKAYIMTPCDSRHFSAQYGSIDDVAAGRARTVKTPYESYLYWIRYYEKLSKGYVDQSDVYFPEVSANSDDGKTDSSAASDADRELYSLLFAMAKNLVSKVCAIPPTAKLVEKAHAIFDRMCRRRKVETFNADLKELIALVPRKRNPLLDNVADFFAKDKKDFAKIVTREENLLAAMKAVTNKGGEHGSFAASDIDVFPANKKQEDEVMSMLGAHLRPMVSRIWRVKPHAQEEKFSAYCKVHGIKRIKKFWHGSRNENWASIILNSLEIHPNARITGKMFGMGIYFAPSPSKSFGYTSYHGTRWAGGHSDVGFMGIFATALGESYEPTGAMNAEPAMRRAGKDSVYAYANKTGLMNDEVIFYNEDAVVLNYLVEFK